jgi:heat shock protein 1/8
MEVQPHHHQERGRLNQAEIYRMLAERQKYKEQDVKQYELISARNQLESYIFSVKQSVKGAGDQVSSKDKNDVLSACGDALNWLDSNSCAEKDELEDRLKEIHQISASVISKLHS